MISSQPSKARISGYVLAAGLSLLASGVKAEAPQPENAPVKGSPVVAMVNGVEITRREVDYLYARVAPPNLPPEVALARKRAIAAELVRAEALAQKAAADKLDQTADFEIEMQIARRGALAARAERALLKGMTPVSAQTAFDYVNNNPRLFAERQLLTLEQMNMIKTDDQLLDKLDQASDNGASLDKIERLARESRADTQRQIFNSYSDRLPPELLKALLKKPYQPVLIKFEQDKSRGSVLLVHASVPAPLTGREAMQAAGNFLTSRQLQSTRQQGSSAIVEAAKVSYFGEFSGTAQPATDALANGAAAASISLERRIAIAGGLAAAAALLVLTALMAWRYWHGISRRDPQPASRLLQRLPLLGRLFAEPPATATRTRVDNELRASWYGKLLVAVGVALSLALIGLQAMGAWNRLPHWTLPASGVAGLLVGSAMAWLYLQSRLSALSAQRRWIPVPLLWLLLVGTSATGIAIT